jgi:hypothetical protein
LQDAQRHCIAEIHDLSLQGLRLTARKHFPRGAVFAVVFLNGEARPLALRCVRVRWGQALEAELWRLGGTFTRELSEAELKALLSGTRYPFVSR